MTHLQNIEISIFNKKDELVKTLSVRKGSNLWVMLRKNNVPIGSACSGVGVCGACCITPLTPNQDALSIQSEFERNTLIKNGKTSHARLGCLTRVYDNISIKADYW